MNPQFEHDFLKIIIRWEEFTFGKDRSQLKLKDYMDFCKSEYDKHNI